MFQVTWHRHVSNQSGHKCLHHICSVSSSHYVQAIRHRPCKYHILSASLEISSHSFKETLMFIRWKKSVLVLKSTGTVCVLYPWFPGLAVHGLEKSCSWLAAVATLGCWSCISYISLHHRLYLKKAPTKSFLFSFHLLPLILAAPGMHRTCCFSVVCWCSPKFTVWLEMWWPDSSFVPIRFGPSSGKGIFWHQSLWSVSLILECLQHKGGEWQLGYESEQWLCCQTPSLPLPSNMLCWWPRHGLCWIEGLKSGSSRCCSGGEVLSFLHGIFC